MSAGINMQLVSSLHLTLLELVTQFYIIKPTSTVDISIAGGGGGARWAGTDKVFYENDQTVTQTYTISAGKNAMVQSADCSCIR